MTRIVPYGGRDGHMVPDDFFVRFFGDGFLSDIFPTNMTRPMRADIKETEKEYLLDVEMPGLKKEQIEVSFDDGVLTISSKQEDVYNEERENYIRKERRYGSMQRSFGFPDVEHESIAASYENGVLHLTLPKKADSRPAGRKIDVT